MSSDTTTLGLVVLLVEPSSGSRDLIQQIAVKESFELEVDEVSCQADFDESMQRQRIDLMIAASQFDWGDGLDVLRQAKQTHPYCRVILQADRSDQQLIHDALDHGVDDCVIHDSDMLMQLHVSAKRILRQGRDEQNATHIANRLDFLLSHLNFSYFASSKDGVFQEICPATSSSVPSPYETLPNGCIQDLFASPQDAQRFLSEVVRSQGVVEAEFEGSHGDERYYRICARYFPRGKSPERIEGFIEDVTDRPRWRLKANERLLAQSKLHALSPRESQVFEYVCQGLPNKATARRLGISEKTVEKHRSAVMKKLRARSVADLVYLRISSQSAVPR